MKLKVDDKLIIFEKNKNTKNIEFGVCFCVPYKLEYSESYNIINSLLNKINQKFPTEELLRDHLIDCYSMIPSIDATLSGKRMFFEFSVTIINPKYIDEKIDLKEKAFEMLEAIILYPLFDAEKIEQIKKSACNNALNMPYRKANFAYRRFIEYFKKGTIAKELACTDVSKNTEKIKSVTIDLIKDAYNSIISSSRIYYAIGDIEKEEVENFFKKLKTPKALTSYKRSDAYDFPIFPRKNRVVEIEDEVKSSISYLFLGGKTKINRYHKDRIAFAFLSSLCGEYNFSELNKRVREENSMAYFVDSSCSFSDGTMFFVLEIAKENFEIAKEICFKILEDIKCGNFDEEKIKMIAKKYENILKAESKVGRKTKSTIMTIFDLKKPRSNKKLIEMYNSVTKEDIMKVATSFNFDTIYFLRGVE